MDDFPSTEGPGAGPRRVQVWKPRLECPGVHQFPGDYGRALEWNADLKSWVLVTPIRTHRGAGRSLRSTSTTAPSVVTIPLYGHPAAHGNATHVFHPCRVDPVMPNTTQHLVRRCEPDAVRACAPNWTNQEMRSRCEAYTAFVYLDKTPYRNVHCAICNNIALQYVKCWKTPTRSFSSKEFSPAAFYVLFDLTGSGSVGMAQTRICPSTQLYDPFFRTCRAVVCPLSGEGSTTGECVNGTRPSVIQPLEPAQDHVGGDDLSPRRPTEDSGHSASRAEQFARCPKFLLNPFEFELAADNRSAVVVAYNRTFLQDEFQVTPDGRLAICVYASGVEFVDKFGPYMGYVTLVGLGVSVVFLLLHLLAFALVPELRNLSGKNLASLCLSLLVAYLGFIASQLISKEDGRACLVAAVLTYYSFLASFSWMLTMALDIWRTLCRATSELRVSGGKQWRKFVLYSVWTWLMPAAIVCAALLTDAAAPGSVDDSLRPGFGLHACWFAHRKALLVFFAAPLGVIMLLNVLLFASSALMIVRTASASRYTPPPGGSSGTRRDFRLYIRLALVMGLTWVVGLIAGILDIEALWYAFVALNTLQGLFIFLAFTCNEKVVRGLGEALPCACVTVLCGAVGRAKRGLTGGSGDKSGIRPPSFSWSGSGGSGSASNDSTHKSALESSSESSSPSHHGVPASNGHHNGHGHNGHGLNGHGHNGHGHNGHGHNGHGVSGHSSVRHPGHRHHHATSDTLY
ncbi:hypothetical protein ONE63_005343 [Megalurothrips usitatus]|uniref:G-protein coupled receptors family 2 profile 2 domain-containing protein n=1 Tax=Megalurothrips usitatus TaxID=439358 RepID=A0AAV7Y017_9NEOP|nr:hypothetical protein ONE63_005343 [Megalurothrips usitatus]